MFDHLKSIGIWRCPPSTDQPDQFVFRAPPATDPALFESLITPKQGRIILSRAICLPANPQSYATIGQCVLIVTTQHVCGVRKHLPDCQSPN